MVMGKWQIEKKFYFVKCMPDFSFFFFFWLSLKQPVSKAFFQRHSEGLDQEPLSNGPVEATRNIHQYLWNVL